jgi:hypothetical protein
VPEVTQTTIWKLAVSDKVIHMRNGVDDEGSVAEGVVYVGDRMPPSMIFLLSLPGTY